MGCLKVMVGVRRRWWACSDGWKALMYRGTPLSIPCSCPTNNNSAKTNSFPLTQREKMATHALASYSGGKYDEALTHLSQLVVTGRTDDGTGSASGASGAGDFRTLHNRALCEHGQRGFSDPAELESALQAIQIQLRGKARGVDAEDEGSEEAERAKVALIGSSGGAAAAAATGLADLDADASVLLYNISALHFQQKQYGAAQAVLEHLFLHIEPLDESLAIHICLLLLDVLCHSARGNLCSEANLRRFAVQSAAVLAFLERPHALTSPFGDSR